MYQSQHVFPKKGPCCGMKYEAETYYRKTVQILRSLDKVSFWQLYTTFAFKMPKTYSRQSQVLKITHRQQRTN